jgi:uncharacterized membrane protein
MSGTILADKFFLKIFNFFQKSFELFQSKNKEDNVTTVVYRALKHHRIKVTLTYTSEYLKTHPNYPSFKSICDFFEELKVQNYALRYNESDLNDLNYPFIAHFKESGGKVIFVYSVNNECIVYADSLMSKEIMRTADFYKKWDGAVIVIEPTKLSGEPDYNEKRKAEIINSALLPTSILIFVVAAFYGIYINKFFSSFPQGTVLLVLILTHLAGLTFSVLLLRQELNLKTKFTDKLCHIATNADCDAVTKSKASKIFGSITWADAGVAYFIGGLITLFLVPVTSSLNILSILTIAALPYPIFSILYQWLKIKKWCPLCLSVQFVIILESVVAVNLLKINELNIISFIPVLIVFSIVFLIELLLKYLFISDREKEHLKLESLKMKRDSDIFLYKLKKGERIDIPSDMAAFTFGDIQSEVLISVFLSFHCGACAKRFDTILKLIANNYKLKVQLIFSPAKDEMSATLLKAIFRLIITDQKNKALEELNKWYKTDMKTRSKLPIVNNIRDMPEGFENMINYNSSLFRIGKVVAVPSIFVNGYPMPETYSLDDIRYHIAELEKTKNELIEIDV